ncbi:MAG: hypothetical protein EBU88_08595 [Acidobacteria bacterium]|nr:hypothetical protein [Acidobacteriota bacterium]
MVMSGASVVRAVRYGVLAWFMATGLAGLALGQIRFDRPKTEAPLDNPYTLGVPREQIISNVRDVLKGCGISIKEDSGQSSGKIVTGTIIFARGVTSRNNLEHLATMPSSEVRNWQQGRFYLEITALPLDQKRSQLYVAAHIEGRYSDPGSGAIWVEGQSNGRLEDEILRGLAGKILGIDLSLKTATNERRILNCTY